MDTPDGIQSRNLTCNRRQRAATLLGPPIIGLFLLFVVIGVFGGYPAPTVRSDTPAAALSVKMPRVLRNGEFFEMTIAATPARPFRDLTIGIPAPLWRDVTQNTMIPAAGDEDFANGLYRFHYGAWDAGRPIVVKIDLQLNPPTIGRLSGTVLLLDGDEAVARVPATMKVWP